MSTELLVAVAVVAVIVAIIAIVSASQARVRRDENRRIAAREHREEAAIRSARADAQEAEAEERAARARREQALAEEQAALAHQERRVAQERHAEADRLDPDGDGGEADGEPAERRSENRVEPVADDTQHRR